MDIVEIIGWLAAAFTMAVYLMRTMLPLRVMGVLANISFIAYGYLEDIPPTLFLHLALLPINLSRLGELLLTLRKIRNVRVGEPALDWLKSIEPVRRFERSHTLFRVGETADKIYYLKSGSVELPEISRQLGPGEIFGEVAFFTDERRRTASAVCATECEIIVLDEKTFMRAFYQTPEFGTFITGVIAKRLADATIRIQEDPKLQ